MVDAEQVNNDDDDIVHNDDADVPLICILPVRNSHTIILFSNGIVFVCMQRKEFPLPHELFPPAARVFQPKPPPSRYIESFHSFKKVAFVSARYREPETNVVVLKKYKFWLADENDRKKKKMRKRELFE